MIRRFVIIACVALASLLTAGAIASLFTPIDLVPVQSDLRLFRVSFRNGDLQIAFVRPKKIGGEGGSGVDVKYALTPDFEVISGRFTFTDSFSWSGDISVPSFPKALLNAVDPQNQVRRWFGLGYWHCSPPHVVRVEWSTAESLTFVSPGVPGGSTVSLTAIRFPTWPVVVLLFVYPVVALLRGPLRRRRRRRRGQCENCGYDLTGNTSGICSECGAELNQAS